MSDFKGENARNLISNGAQPQTHGRAYIAFSDPLAALKGFTSKRKGARGDGRGGKWLPLPFLKS